MRTIIKKGDRVRFRTDGEIGEYNRIYGHDKLSPQYVHEVSADGAWAGLDERTVGSKVDLLWQVQSILLDICNDPTEKPKPLLADAKVGDLCQTRGEGYHLISDVYTDQRKYAYERNCGDTIYVCENGMFNLINYEHPFDIIHTEPLATEGSAEWAWQMLKLGKPVTHKLVFFAGGYIKDTDSDKYQFVQMWGCSGWQLYEPEPEPKPEHPAINGYNRYNYIPVEGIRQPKPAPGEPVTKCMICNKDAVVDDKTVFLDAKTGKVWHLQCSSDLISGVFASVVSSPQPEFKVGDWVLQSYAAHLQRQVKILEIAGEKFRARIQGLLLNSWFDMDSIVRKLDKSEVKVSVTLEGTVSKDYDETLDSFILNNADGTRNRIKLSTIDPATAAMVRELVEKEES